MQISQSAFDVLHLMKHSDLELYAYFLLSLDLSDLTRAGTYTRNIVSFESGTLKTYSVKILRIRRREICLIVHFLCVQIFYYHTAHTLLNSFYPCSNQMTGL